MNNITNIYAKNPLANEFFEGYGLYLSQIFSSLDYKSLANVVEVFLQARDTDHTIYFAGNGGSASTASHFAQDIAEIGRKAKSDLFRTYSLTDNVSSLTAVGNDYGYDQIFAIPLRGWFRKGDVLVVISASGNSTNIIEAVKVAKSLSGITVGFTGFDGGKLNDICDHVVQVTTPKGEYGPVEDLHLIFNHMIVSYLIEHLSRK